MVAWMRGIVVTLALVGLTAACTSAVAPSPTASPSKAATAPSPAAKPAEAKTSAEADWKAEWDKTLAAAKQEGKVVVYGPPGADIRKVLAEDFEKAYGIPVEFWGVAGGGQLAARVMNERQAGQYVNDLFIFGSTTLWGPLGSALAPLEGSLIRPDVKDKQNWKYWEFADAGGKTVFSMQADVGNMAVVNKNLVKLDEIKSLNNLLESKWKGKIVVADPRIAGQGEYSLTAFYDIMGEQYLTRFLKEQQPTISGNVEQITEWVAHGRFPIAVSAGHTLIQKYVAEGVPIEGVSFAEGSYISPGYYGLAMSNRPPHPNAAKVYANWVLGKEAQLEISKASGKASMRVDVSTDHLRANSIPVEGTRYWRPHLEKNEAVGVKVKGIFDEIYGK